MKGRTARAGGRRKKRSVRLFISYSHRDKVWMDRLKPLLDSFPYDERVNRLGLSLNQLHPWHDSELKAGNPWDGEIKQELAAMDIFVPLVSAHFFASWYVQKVELPAAKKRHKADAIKVVPIILYDTNLRDRCRFLEGFPRYPTSDRWWSNYPDPADAHRAIDDALWEAIEGALASR